VRLFVALDLPAEVRASLSELTERLKKRCRSPRWVRFENVHVTLKFIGEVPDERVERISRMLAGIRGLARVEMRFAGLGFFPDERHPRVFWAGIEAAPALPALASAIEAVLEPLGVPRDKRTFQPHITLARLNSMEGVSALRSASAEIAGREFGRFTATQFYLYRSVLKTSGAEYTRLETYSFVGDQSS
jgi:2'-5' RNA ligase